MKIIKYRIIDSTYAEAGRLSDGRLPAGEYLLLADGQTAGRGRGDHTFHSPPGNGIYATLLIIPSAPVDASLTEKITEAAAVCLTEAVDAATGYGERLSVKPINDLMFDGLKYGGILCGAKVSETDGRKLLAVKIGYGIDLGQAELPPGAVSLNWTGDAGALAADGAERIVSRFRRGVIGETEDGSGTAPEGILDRELEEKYISLTERYFRKKG